MSSPTYLIPMFWSVLVISESAYWSNRLVMSSVKMTKGEEVCYSVSAHCTKFRSHHGMPFQSGDTNPAVRAVLVLVEGAQA